MQRTPAEVAPTFHGYIESTADVLLVLQAVLDGKLATVSRRPYEIERPQLIASGNLFVFIEETSGIRRWTDGVPWSPSRILGKFLVYRELDKRKKSPPSLAPLNGAAPPPHQSPHAGSTSSATSSSSSSHSFRSGGLVKKAMSLHLERSPHLNLPLQHHTIHIISYFTAEDVDANLLKTPTNDPFFKDIKPCSELMDALEKSTVGSSSKNSAPSASRLLRADSTSSTSSSSKQQQKPMFVASPFYTAPFQSLPQSYPPPPPHGFPQSISPPAPLQGGFPQPYPQGYSQSYPTALPHTFSQGFQLGYPQEQQTYGFQPQVYAQGLPQGYPSNLSQSLPPQGPALGISQGLIQGHPHNLPALPQGVNSQYAYYHANQMLPPPASQVARSGSFFASQDHQQTSSKRPSGATIQLPPPVISQSIQQEEQQASYQGVPGINSYTIYQSPPPPLQHGATQLSQSQKLPQNHQQHVQQHFSPPHQSVYVPYQNQNQNQNQNTLGKDDSSTRNGESSSPRVSLPSVIQFANNNQEQNDNSKVGRSSYFPK